MSSDDDGLGILEEPEKPQAPPKLPKKEEAEAEEPKRPEIPEEERPKIYTIKTQVGQERNVADQLAGKIRKKNQGIASILAPQELRGYVFVEAQDFETLSQMIRPISYARSLLEGEVPFEQVEHFLTPVSAVAKIAEGDIVELVAGPFKGEKAKVTRIDDTKEEITVELFEALVPIPITVRGESVRVLKRKDE